MAKVVTFIVYLFVITGFVLFTAHTVQVWAEDSGYEGLIAAPPAETPAAAPETAAPPPEDSGYGGLLAPAPAPVTGGQAPKQQEPAGYGGLIPGYVGDTSPAGNPAAPEKQQPQTSQAPGAGQPASPKTSDDLKGLAARQAQDRNGNGIPDSLEKVQTVSEKAAKILATPYERIENMLPTEYMAKQNIEQLMAKVTDKKIPPETRAENARKAHKSLETLADGLRFKKVVPDKIYRDMGLPDSFISEEKEGNEKALVRLNKALNDLKGYE